MKAKSHHMSGLLYALRAISLNGRQQVLELLRCYLGFVMRDQWSLRALPPCCHHLSWSLRSLHTPALVDIHSVYLSSRI